MRVAGYVREGSDVTNAIVSEAISERVPLAESQPPADGLRVVQESQERMNHYDSPAVFLFVVGVEGTGHHLFNKIFNQSPSRDRLRSWGVPYSVLPKALWYQEKSNKGLLSAPCAKLLGHKAPNGPELVERTAALLREIDGIIKANHIPEKHGKSTVVPLSSSSPGRPGKDAGMMSYPNFRSPCRTLSYPDLSVLYDVCDQAKVNCRHALIHRDPHAVIRSTTINRRHSEIGAQIKTLATMLHVMRTQIIDYPERLVSCWDYDSSVDSENGRIGGGVLELGILLGWTESEFTDLYNDIFNPSSPMNDTMRDEIVREELRPFMKTFVRANDRVIDTCRDIYDAYHPALAA